MTSILKMGLERPFFLLYVIVAHLLEHSTLYVIAINGDNTFYTNRITFLFYAGAQQYVDKCSGSSYFKFF